MLLGCKFDILARLVFRRRFALAPATTSMASPARSHESRRMALGGHEKNHTDHGSATGFAVRNFLDRTSLHKRMHGDEEPAPADARRANCQGDGETPPRPPTITLYKNRLSDPEVAQHWPWKHEIDHGTLEESPQRS